MAARKIVWLLERSSRPYVSQSVRPSVRPFGHLASRTATPRHEGAPVEGGWVNVCLSACLSD